MIKINLLPYREIVRKESIVTHATIAIVSLSLVMVSIVLAESIMRSKINDVKNDISKTEKEIASSKVQLEEIETLKKEKEVYRKQFEVIENLKKDKEGPVRIMDDLATRIPDKIWLETLKQIGNNIELAGIAVDNNLISKFMSNLENSPYFKKVDLISSEMKVLTSGKTKEKLHKFTLICIINSPSQG